MPVGIPLTTAALLAAKAAGTSGVALGAGKTALAAGAGTGIGALPDIIPSRYERDQKKRLREMQRKQEMGALGLTERERAAIESQMRGTRQQAQAYADAERGRLTQPSAQPQMALLGQQMADESRQRLEADLASQVLGMDLSRQAEQEQEIKDLEAAQAEYKRRRFEGAVSPFQSASEAYVGQLGLEQLLGNQQDMGFMQGQTLLEQILAQRAFRNQAIEAGVQTPTIDDVMQMTPDKQYNFMFNELEMDDEEISQYFQSIGQSKNIQSLGVKASDVAGTSAGLY